MTGLKLGHTDAQKHFIKRQASPAIITHAQSVKQIKNTIINPKEKQKRSTNETETGNWEIAERKSK